mmetsp:Transcript_31710/g.53280  ORF Transcript_31710/g.53280 Transcript_31710/m.53280 type:complete len:231 (+) Transcript_31710:421-1113(+)
MGDAGGARRGTESVCSGVLGTASASSRAVLLSSRFCWLDATRPWSVSSQLRTRAEQVVSNAVTPSTVLAETRPGANAAFTADKAISEGRKESIDRSARQTRRSWLVRSHTGFSSSSQRFVESMSFEVRGPVGGQQVLEYGRSRQMMWFAKDAGTRAFMRQSSAPRTAASVSLTSAEGKIDCSGEKSCNSSGVYSNRSSILHAIVRHATGSASSRKVSSSCVLSLPNVRSK